MSWFSFSRATSVAAVAWLVSFGAPAVADDTVKAGETVYSQTCVACHGANGKGVIPGVSDLTAADGPLAKSDEELTANVRDGLVTPGKPLSMPPKGGNPALSDEDIRAVIAYLRQAFGS